MLCEMSSTTVMILSTIVIISLRSVCALDQQCGSEKSHVSHTVKRIFQNQRINNTENAYQYLVSTIHACDLVCNSVLSSKCFGFSYSYETESCFIFNSTDLKHRLIAKQGTDIILILPKTCKENTTGAWSSWNVINLHEGSPAWSGYYYHRTCLESEEGCNDALCVDGLPSKTIFCKGLQCQGNNTAVEVNQSGTYMFNILGIQTPIYVEVDQSASAWIQIQRRYDGSVDFYRDWLSYKSGFGNFSGEFWLGNDIIHEFTKGDNAMIRFDLFDGEEWRYADYNYFQIEDESQWYRLTVGGYSGNGFNSFAAHNGRYFSTQDSDQDTLALKNCATKFKGAWWFGGCHKCHLNGLYLNRSTQVNADGLNWRGWKGNQFSLLKTTMKIRFN